MARSYSEIVTGVEEPSQKGVKSYNDLVEERRGERVFAHGLDKVAMEGELQKFMSKDIDENEKYKLANSLYISRAYKIPFNQAYQNYDGVVGQMFQREMKPKQVFEKIQWASMTDQQRFDTYHKNAPAQQEFTDFFKSRWQRTKAQFAGLVEFGTDISTGIHPSFGDKLNEWSVSMREGVQQYMQENPGQFLNPPGDSFWDTTKNYIAHPEAILGGVAEQVPMILAATLSSGTAGAVAKAAGASQKAIKATSFIAGVQGFAIPITGELYSGLRSENVAPMQAIPEAILAGQAQGALEEWTRLFNLKLFKGAGSASKRGISEMATKWLLKQPKPVRAAYRLGTTYLQGFSEEGIQQVSDNFWEMVFRNPNKDLMDNVLQAGASGGLLELAMGEGAHQFGRMFNKGYVPLEEQLARVELIRDQFNDPKMGLNTEQKAEVNRELDSIREKVEQGEWSDAERQEETPQTPQAETVLEEAQPTPQGQGEVVEEQPREPRYGIIETKDGWVVKDFEQNKIVSRPNTDRIALKKAQFMNDNPEVGDPDDTIRPNLYIGNVTQRMKRAMGAGQQGEVSGFTEGGFPTNRTEIPMTRQEAIEYLQWLENDIDKRLNETRTEVVDGIPRKVVVNLTSERDVAQLRADYKDTREIRKALGYPDVSQPFKVYYPKAKSMVFDPSTPLNKLKKDELVEMAELLDLDTTGVKKEILKRINDYIEANETTAQKVVQEAIDAASARATVVKTRKEVIRQAVRNESDKKVTIKQALEAVFSAKETESKKAFLAGAMDLQKQHHDLSRLINQLLDGVDITPAKRALIMDSVAKSRTETSQINAIALASKLRADAMRNKFTNELKTLVRKINRRMSRDIDKGGFLPDFRSKIQDVVNSFLTKEISPKQRQRLEDLILDIRRMEEAGVTRFGEAFVKLHIPKSLLNGLDKMNLKPISKMSLGEITETINTLNELVHFNDEAVNVLLEDQATEAIQNIESAREDAAGIQDKASLNNPENINYDPNKDVWYKQWAKKAKSFLAGSMNHDPETLSETLGGGRNTLWSVVTRGMRDGRYRQAETLNTLNDITDRIISERGINLTDLQDISSAFYRFARNNQLRQKAGAKTTPTYKVNVGGKQVDMEMSQLISIYMHSLAYDYNLPAMIKSGIASPKRNLGKITPQELARISDIVEKNKTAMAVVDIVREQTAYLKEQINAVSRMILGRDLANDDNHFHVERYRAGKGGIAGKEVPVIKNLFESTGYLQERVGGDDPIVIRDVFEVVLAEQQAISEYVGLAEPLRKIKSVANDKTLRESFIQKGYADELKYFDTIIGRIEGHDIRLEETDKFVSFVTSGLTRSVLANPGIMLGQRTSAIQYLTESDMKYARQGKINYNKEFMQRFLDNIPWLRRRVNQGLTSIAIYEIAQSDIALREFGGQTDVMNNLLKGINYFDSQAMMDGAMVVESEMADSNLQGKSLEYWTEEGVDPTTLEKDSPEYWKAFSDRLYYLVRRTQPMFFTENRSVLTSSEKPTAKMFFLFRSYIDQPLRIMYRAFLDKQYGRISSGTFAKRIGTVWTSLAAYEVVRFAIDKGLFRSDDDEKDLFIKIATAPIKLMPVFGQPASQQIEAIFDAVVKGERKGKTFYGLSPLPVRGIEDIFEDVSLFAKAATYLGSNERMQGGPDNGELKSAVYLNRAIYELTKDVLKYAGVPTEVIEDLIKGKGKEQPKKTRL